MSKKELELRYNEEVSKGFGTLVITGVVFPKTSVYDPLSKIWSSVKKRIVEKYNVHVAGTFSYKKGQVNCSFWLNYGNVRNTTEAEELCDRFTRTFSGQMALFESTLESFILDFEDGYIPYVEYMKNDALFEEEVIEQMFDDFLKKISVKTLADEKAKAKFQRKLSRLCP